jgi:hypothetical protein
MTVISSPRPHPIIMGGCEIVDAAWHDGGSPIARGSSANRAAPQNKISSIIRKARKEAGVPRDVESGQRLHARCAQIRQRSCEYQTLMRHRRGRPYRAPKTLRGGPRSADRDARDPHLTQHREDTKLSV